MVSSSCLLPFKADHGEKNKIYYIFLKRKPLKSMTKGRRGAKRGRRKRKRRKEAERGEESLRMAEEEEGCQKVSRS